MVLDLDSFAEAVSNCVAGDDGNNASDMPRFEAFDAPLLNAAPRSRSMQASSASVEAGDDKEEYMAPLSVKLASVALASVAGLAIASTVMRRR